MESSAFPVNLSSTLSPAMLNTPQMEDMTTNQHVGYSVKLDFTQQTFGKYIHIQSFLQGIKIMLAKEKVLFDG